MTTALRATAGPSVGIGQIVASDDPGVVISALGLGSCIGLVLTDAQAGVAGMAHVMLPVSRAGADGSPGKFADTAVPALLDQVLRLGAQRVRLHARMAGGAQMFAAGGGSLLNIGERNTEAVREALRAAGLRVRAADTGGNAGRSMHVAVAGGAVTVRAVGGEPIDL
ncbi:MAG TPA: chemotaxis protein CheD [Miltoncostaeaceae bacterium]|nr:chemotaxis protein CheD [Miltoncostaeaceae bacterium]